MRKPQTGVTYIALSANFGILSAKMTVLSAKIAILSAKIWVLSAKTALLSAKPSKPRANCCPTKKGRPKRPPFNKLLSIQVVEALQSVVNSYIAKFVFNAQ